MMRWLLFMFCLLPLDAFSKGVYQTPEGFVQSVFLQHPPQLKTLWITQKMQPRIENILSHRYPALRIRYWEEGQRSAWILDEIGKDHPITVGIAIDKDKIHSIQVLEFRESRGDEVRHAFFADQFRELHLSEDDHLSKPIDGISGATLSVRALTKLARLALYLHTQVMPAPYE